MSFKTYCNPLAVPNIGEGMFSRENKKHYREIADPDVLYDNGKWYMVASLGKVFSSEDGVAWHFHEVNCPAFNEYAPCICKFRGKYYVTSNQSKLYVADSPLGEYKLLGNFRIPKGFKKIPDGEYIDCYPDPDLFADGDNGLYLFWGCGYEIYGSKLCDDDLTLLETNPKTLIKFNPENEWERAGAYNQNKKVSWTEGACMYYRNGAYYLLYSCAATQFPTYTMGVYKSDSPLGEFTPQTKNPLVRGGDGYVKGSGHGCVVDGPQNTAWVFYTSVLGGYHRYERRIGMDRVYFNESGEMHAFGPSGRPRNAPSNTGKECDWLPLSAHCGLEASSEKEGREAIYAVDENTKSWWQPDDKDEEPRLTVALGDEYLVKGARVVWREVGLDYGEGIAPEPVSYIIEGKLGDKRVLLYDGTNNDSDLCCDYREFPPTPCVEITLKFKQKRNFKLGVIDFTVFGNME